MKQFRELKPTDDIRTWGRVINDYTCIIGYDPNVPDAFTASVKKLWQPVQFLGHDRHPSIGLPCFKTMEEAQKACEEYAKGSRAQVSRLN